MQLDLLGIRKETKSYLKMVAQRWLVLRGYECIILERKGKIGLRWLLRDYRHK